MHILIYVRPLIVDISILIALLTYNHEFNKIRSGKSRYERLGVMALLFVVLGLIIQILINQPSEPGIFVQIIQRIYIVVAIGTIIWYFDYVISTVANKLLRNKIKKYELIVGAVVAIISVAMPVNYIKGEITSYASGMGLNIAFIFAVVEFIISDVVLFINRKRVPLMMFSFTFGTTIFSMVYFFLQYIYPEFLFVESVVAMITVMVFFMIEAQVDKLQSRIFIDIDTGAHNKKCFEYDMQNLQDFNESMACIVCDINNLKYVNDNFGHFEGDRLISAAAEIIMNNVSGRVYRMGGDEFLVFLKNVGQKEADLVVKNIHAECEKRSQGFKHELSIAIGCAIQQAGETVPDLVLRADKLMYAEKQRMKEEQNN